MQENIGTIFIETPAVENVPKKSTEWSAGHDIKCLTDFSVAPGEQIELKTGIKMKLPYGKYAELRTRSSMARSMVRVEAGIIDSDFTGEILVFLFNYGKKEYHGKAGNKVAQMIFHKCCGADFCVGKVSGGGHEGFGSTGQ